MEKNILIALLGLVFLNSCQEKNKVIFPVSYEMKHVMVNDDACADTIEKCTKLDVEYFEFEGAQGYIANLQTSQMIEYISGLPIHDSIIPVEETAQLLIQRFRDFKRDFPDSRQYWSVSMKSRVIFENDKLLCIEMVTGSFLGGAHGNFLHSFLTINNAGDRVHAIDLITDVKKFAEIAEEKYREQRGLSKGESLNKDGYFFPDGKFILPEGIGLSEKGFVLYYNVYEIAPFYKGGTELILSYQSLKGILRKPYFN